MTDNAIELDTLLDARVRLIADVTSNMPDRHKEFLVSFYNRNPNWELLELEGINELPAVKWRELNLDRAGEGTRDALVKKLRRAIYV